MTVLVLASASPARLTTLRNAGIEPVVHVSGVDEDAVLEQAGARLGRLDTADAVLVLAQAKAEAVARVREAADAAPPGAEAQAGPESAGALVLGCDSLLELDGQAFGKPRDPEQAVERWQRMRGRTGVLHTGHWLVDQRPGPLEDGPGTGGTLGRTTSTTVHFADVTDAEIEAYVASGEPLAVAGAFTLDGLGGPFVEAVEGDHHNVVGLSLPTLRGLLRDIGVSVTDLWRPTTEARQVAP